MIRTLRCDEVDEVDAAYALGALESDEAQAVTGHLSSCAQPHTQLRAFLRVAAAVPTSVEPVQPPPHVRSRLLRTARATPQDHRRALAAPPAAPFRARPGWRAWLAAPALRVAAAAGVAALVVGLGAWNLDLRSQLGQREVEIREAAQLLGAADSAYRVEGSAGSGFLVRDDQGATALLTGLQPLGEGDVYHMWLLAGESVIPAGTFTPERGDELVIVPVRPDLGDYSQFAVTIESGPIDAPTAEPVMVATLTP